jgi:hypothetical protein
MSLTENKSKLKTQYPVVRIGSDETGYTELSADEYESTIVDWAKNYPAPEKTKIELEAEAEANATAKAALLARLGITADEATLLLS